MLQGILRQVQVIQNEIRGNGSTAIWYRGHRRSEWELKSTLHRYVERLTADLAEPMSLEERKELLREEAKSLYRRFKAEAWPLLRAAERSDWGVLFAMQHYRLPTRVLDWTESFACALFFAQQHRKRGEAAAIWVLDSEALNEVSVGRRGLISLDESLDEGIFDVRPWHPKWVPQPEDLPTIAVSPIFTNPRMTAQRSVFTLTGDGFSPLQEQFGGRLAGDGILRKLEVAPDGFDEVEAYLNVNGLRAFTYGSTRITVGLGRHLGVAAAGTRR
jgi:hypothetical protein